ncbi:MAG: DUF2163 domain-containing protein [Chlorobiaceae bacterium]
MKPATTELLELLASNRQFACCDLFTIVRQNGDTMRLTTSDVPIYWNDSVFSCYGVQPSGVRYRIVTGLEADEQTLMLSCDRAVVIDDKPFLDAVQSGALDGARVKRERAYMESWTMQTPSGAQPVGCITLFTGFVSSIDSLTRTSAEFRVKSDLALLDVSMPRNTWQASCTHTLYDSGCGLDRASWGSGGTAEAGSTDFIVNWSGATSGYFWNGVVSFTSGLNTGLRRTIKNSNGYQLFLAYTLPFAVAEGDTFVAYPGCDHTMSACAVRFSNLDNYRGYPFIPAVETAI